MFSYEKLPVFADLFHHRLLLVSARLIVRWKEEKKGQKEITEKFPRVKVVFFKPIIQSVALTFEQIQFKVFLHRVNSEIHKTLFQW